VLDPACGSGNFLYIALQALKDLEREAIIWASTTLRAPMQFPEIGPEVVKGIELNGYAAEIARVVIWIGEIQWMLNNGFAYRRNPILRQRLILDQPALSGSEPLVTRITISFRAVNTKWTGGRLSAPTA
jgi:hypothetical protein